MYSNPLEEYLALIQGAAPVPYQTPAERMQQGLSAIPTQSELNPPEAAGNPYDSMSAIAPYFQSPGTQDFSQLTNAYGLEMPPPVQVEMQDGDSPGYSFAPMMANDPQAPPPIDTSLAVREPGATQQQSLGDGPQQAIPAHMKPLLDAYQQGQQKAAEIAGQQDGIMQQRQALAEMRAQAQAEERNRIWETVRQTSAEVAKPLATPDPSKWFSNQSTLGKVMTALALGLTAVGEGMSEAKGATGELLSAAINNDLQQQKAKYETEKSRRQGAYQAATNLWGMARQNFSDDNAAWQMANGLAYQAVGAQAERLAATTQNAQAQQHYKEQAANLSVASQQYYESAANIQFQRNQAVQVNERANAALGMQARGLELEAQRTNAAGMKVDKDTQKGMAEIEERSRAIKASVGRLQSNFREYGTAEVFGPQEEEMERDLNSIAVDMAKLRDKDSAAREGEVAMERKGLPQLGAFKNRDTAKELLKSYLDMVERRRIEAYRVRGFEPPGLRRVQ
jgi:hypothetical protein